jgi:hypothetical protein
VKGEKIQAGHAPFCLSIEKNKRARDKEGVAKIDKQ